jgi:PAS domain S-box-containing protein
VTALARGAEERAPANGAGRDDSRLRHLYEVSQLLTRFGDVEPTLFAVIAVVRRAMSLRCAIVILDAGCSRRTISWHADGVSAGWLRASEKRARESYAYLAGAVRASHPDSSDASEDGESPPSEHELSPAVLLPFAVEHQPIFGALQLESAERFDEPDVIFVNAIVNQLAVAIDRYVVIEARQAAAERKRLDAEDRQVRAEANQLRAERAEEEARQQRRDVERQRAVVEAERVAAERRRASAEALQERYEALVDNLDHAFVWEADPETYRVSYVSGRAEALLGFPRRRWLDESDLWMSCVHPKDRQQLVQTLAAALAEKADKRCDHRCITADGRVLWFHTGVHVAQRETGARLQGVSIDITPTKAAERRVRGQLDFTRAVTNSLGEGVIAVDLQSRVTLFNPAAARMLGWSPEEVLGQPVTRAVQVFSADGSATPEGQSLLDAAMGRAQLASSDEWFFAGKSGRAFPVSHISGPLEREGRVSGAVIAFQDITERRRTEQALQQAVEQARRAAHDREDLLAVVSHDLKNPLSVILMTVASLVRKPEASSSQHAKDQLQTIWRSAERMNRLIGDLLDSASVDAGKLVVEPEPTAVAPLVEEALDAMRPLAATKALVLESDVPEDVPRVWADPSRLQQVFGNLLGNAVKFTPRGGRITVSAAPVGDRVQFAVADTGSGIAEKDLSQVFDRFWQSHRTARLGSGLGLSIVKGIVSAHGGQVWVKSTLGVGSAFFFTLRAARVEAPPSGERL